MDSLVFNNQDAGCETDDEANQVLQAMMALYNDSVRERPGGALSLPPGCEVRPDPMENLTIDSPLSQWAQGFGMGYEYLSEVWDAYTPDECDEEIGALLMTLTFLAHQHLPTPTIRRETRRGPSISLPSR